MFIATRRYRVSVLNRQMLFAIYMTMVNSQSKKNMRIVLCGHATSQTMALSCPDVGHCVMEFQTGIRGYSWLMGHAFM